LPVETDESERPTAARRGSGPATRLRVRAGGEPLWLCFEPWATDYTIAADTCVVIEFDSEQAPVEITHQNDGMVFFSLGRHPDIWSDDGLPLLVWGDDMPRTPDVAVPAIRNVISLIPPIRTDNGQGNGDRSANKPTTSGPDA